MKKVLITSLSLFLLALLTLGAAKVDDADVKKAAQDNNAFAADMYGKAIMPGKNLIFSPYSIGSAFAMVYAGARGETAAEMEKVLHFSLGQEKLHPAMGALSDDLNKRGRGGKYELSVANRLWGMQGYKFLDSYLDLVKDNYGAGLEVVDFANSGKAARTINGWVEKETRDKIKDLIPESALSGDTRLVLTNAIYFKGKWEMEFKKQNTHDLDFTLIDGAKVKAPTMYQEEDFGYGEGDDFQVLEMDYKGGELSMVVILPKAMDGLPALEKELSAEKLAGWIGSVSRHEVEVFMPRYKLETSLNLKDGLKDLGLTRVFTDGIADLSGMDGTRDLSISAAVHKAFVEVNEEGTEAAAATAIMVGIASAAPMPTPVFRADHPFIFMIRDKKSGAILFMGRVMDPR